jgi:hypothetical protein
MATVNKDFKIKQGLIVEGTTGTINNYNILTESQDSQDFILDLIGGETLVKSVGTNLSVDGAGELSLDLVGIVEDIAGTRLTTDGSTLNVDVDGIADDLTGSYDFATNSDISGAISTEVTNRNDAIAAAVTDLEAYADQAELDAVSTANSYTDGRETAITTAYQNYADQAETDAVSTANAYTDGRETAITTAYQSYADTAEQDAKDYADDLINDASSSSTEVWSAYKTSTEIGLAQTAAQTFATEAIADLVDSAPATLDTLNELAAALQDNPDIISDLQDIAAGKQDTLIVGNGLSIDGANLDLDINTTGGGLYIDPTDKLAVDGYYVTFNGAEQTLTNKTINGADNDITIVAADVSDFNTAALSATSAAYDAAGAAATAEQNAKDYADDEIAALSTTDIEEGTNLYFTNQRAIDAVGGTIGDAIDELTTDDIEEGETNLYFEDSRAKTSAADLLTGASLTNITITGTGAGLTITAENGVADSTTDDLEEGEDNLYFTDDRVLDAVDDAVINPQAVEINMIARQVASTLEAATAGIQIGHVFAKSDFRSAEFLVKVAYGNHTEISKVLLTLDVNDNIAITEYGIVGTNGSASTISADISGDNVRLLVTTANNDSTVTVMGTLLV